MRPGQVIVGRGFCRLTSRDDDDLGSGGVGRFIFVFDGLPGLSLRESGVVLSHAFFGPGARLGGGAGIDALEHVVSWAVILEIGFFYG